MKTVSLDVHADASQMAVITQEGEVLLEMKVPTRPEELRAVIGGIPGPKRVVFEEGPMSGMLHDCLCDLCEEITSCDPAHNALIARAEDANDERDARRLGHLTRLGAVRGVYVAPEPYRTLRSLQNHDERTQRSAPALKNRIGALCRRHAIGSGPAVYWQKSRARVLAALPNGALKWQMESLYRQLDLTRRERVGAHRILGQWTRRLPIVERLDGIPGVGPITARTLAAWICDPSRFARFNQINSYCGLGLGQGWTNWKPVGRARASKRGNRPVKRVLLLAAHAAMRTQTALGRRYRRRLQSGWDHQKAIRDLARTILRCAWVMWKKGADYDDHLIADLPESQ